MITPKYLIVHHCGGSETNALLDTSNQTFEDVNSWHRQNPNTWLGKLSSLGYAIGYHYFIDKTGKVTKGREDWEQAAHCKSYNNNPWDSPNNSAIGICLAGNFDLTFPTKGQINSLRTLLRDKMKQYSIPVEKIVPHRCFASKTCYGKNLPDDWAKSLVAFNPIILDPVINMCQEEKETIKKQSTIISNLRQLVQDLLKWNRV